MSKIKVKIEWFFFKQCFLCEKLRTIWIFRQRGGDVIIPLWWGLFGDMLIQVYNLVIYGFTCINFNFANWFGSVKSTLPEDTSDA